MASTSLDTLPTEILWRIAQHGTAKDAVSMMKTCRRVHNALNDDLVFKQVLQGIQPVVRAAIERQLAGTAGQYPDAWRKLAIAEYQGRRAFAIIENEPVLDEATMKGLDEFLPAMLTLDYGFAYGKHIIQAGLRTDWIPTVAMPLDDLVKDPHAMGSVLSASTGYAFAVCMAVLAAPKQLRNDEEHVVMIIYDYAEAALSGDLKDTFTDSLCLVTLSIWASLLAKHIEQRKRRTDARIPLASTVPMLDLDNSDAIIPLPFQSGAISSWQEWYKSRIEHMSSESFFSDGEWCGYWSYGRGTRCEFAECINCVLLKTMVPETRRRSRRKGLRIRAMYPNGPPGFVLEGNITSEGIFDLGPPGGGWVWRGRMTPFGLFGFWGDDIWDEIAGSCWLWKKAWCEKSERGETMAADDEDDNSESD